MHHEEYIAVLREQFQDAIAEQVSGFLVGNHKQILYSPEGFATVLGTDLMAMGANLIGACQAVMEYKLRHPGRVQEPVDEILRTLDFEDNIHATENNLLEPLRKLIPIFQKLEADLTDSLNSFSTVHHPSEN